MDMYTSTHIHRHARTIVTSVILNCTHNEHSKHNDRVHSDEISRSYSQSPIATHILRSGNLFSLSFFFSSFVTRTRMYWLQTVINIIFMNTMYFAHTHTRTHIRTHSLEHFQNSSSVFKHHTRPHPSSILKILL